MSRSTIPAIPGMEEYLDRFASLCRTPELAIKIGKFVLESLNLVTNPYFGGMDAFGVEFKIKGEEDIQYGVCLTVNLRTDDGASLTPCCFLRYDRFERPMLYEMYKEEQLESWTLFGQPARH